MAIKRGSQDTDAGKPAKQAKLDFGQKMASRSTPTNRNTTKNKAEPTRATNSKSAGSSKDAIIAKLPAKAKNGFSLSEIKGDIFDAPDGTVIIHACNCVGSWGAGIAAAFKQKYPNAHKVYQNHCKNSTPADLIKTALLIPPMDGGSTKHWVGCLFTSKIFGRRKDSPQQILGATAPAMEDLVKQMAENAEDVKEIRICQINSGLFAVPWERSRAVLESLEISEDLEIPREIIVYSLPDK